MSQAGSQSPEDGLYGSWVELEDLMTAVRRDSLTGQDSFSSSLQGELERILLEAQLECERSRDSPPQEGTPTPPGSPRPAVSMTATASPYRRKLTGEETLTGCGTGPVDLNIWHQKSLCSSTRSSRAPSA
ncbi:BCL2/adenovirus E1B 19 kDa protein-interacting protein 3 [Dissostichus eleginoides]|uniref:BCL2/adenovirus E1B 19 kDa protein-interacting protein 3 n=1 Tax=Dissostichus eleginoides TaxID=100907 RepID=A0AAD9BHN7_DISEL|nr:BCL2/adenovirus E1B 19 kDa protein-interacting protein 3 [Dissostichus eleginoides]